MLMVPKDSTATQAELSEALHEIPQIKSILSYADTVGETIPEQYPDSGTLSRLNREHFTRMVLTVDAAYEGNETFSLVEKVRSTAEQYYPRRMVSCRRGCFRLRPDGHRHGRQGQSGRSADG